MTGLERKVRSLVWIRNNCSDNQFLSLSLPGEGIPKVEVCMTAGLAGKIMGLIFITREGEEVGQYYTSYTENEVLEVMRHMAKNAMRINENITKFTAIRNKFILLCTPKALTPHLCVGAYVCCREGEIAARKLAWPRGGHQAQTPAAWRKAKARTTSVFRSESVWSEKTAPQTPRTQSRELCAGRKQPRGCFRALSSPGAQVPEENAFLQQQSEASAAPKRPQPRAAQLLRYERRRCPLRPAPRPPARGKIRFLNQSWESLFFLQLSVLNASRKVKCELGLRVRVGPLGYLARPQP
ncbi:unnamed protein product [Rangifer tarandus platyrhynchus]|uniref:Uncharacterized protein n=1 Tax=Rangifer tarandus platyrhynchus TaxID=3082113 RepID=A0ABN8XSX2_RANTA|nr:unnamed protein product [Rangifer tarandus platyrhynchus]